MAPQTRNTKTSHPQKNNKTKKPSAGASSSVSKKRQEKAKLDTLKNNLESVQKKYDEADPEKKAEIQSQLEGQQKLVDEQTEIVGAMDVDSADDGSDQLNKSSKDIKQENVDGGMFVDDDRHADGDEGPGEPSDNDDRNGIPTDTTDGGTKGKPSRKNSTSESSHHQAPPVEMEDDGPAMMARRLGGLSVEEEHEVQGLINRVWKLKYAIVRYGPRNSPKYLFSGDKGMLAKAGAQLDQESETKRKNGGIAVSKGNIASLRGVVWEPLKGRSRYESLAPRNWRDGNRAKRPRMRIRVKWEGLDEPLWEKRATVAKAWQDIDIDNGDDESTDSVTVNEDVEIGNTVVLSAGERVFKVDYAIVWLACECERLYNEWKNEQRDGREETPDLQQPRR